MTTNTIFKTLAKTAVLTGASARLTRVITTDTLGKYLIHEPIDRAVFKHLEKRQREAETLTGSAQYTSEPSWLKYLEGLQCPWCIGFWIGAGVLATDRITSHLEESSPVGKASRVVFEVAVDSLAMNLVTAPVVAYLDPSN